MFSLYEIMQNAQGGQAVDNLARQFNISPDEADAAVRALLPAVSSAFLTRTAEPAAFGSILGAMGDRQHADAYSDPAAAGSDETAEKGADALRQLFGSGASAQIAQHAAGIAGLPPALLQQMLPVIVSLILGGLSKGMANQGLGGLFGQLANAAGQGGLGSILGSLLGGAGPAQAQPPLNQPVPPAPPADGGLGGMLGSILGGLLGGAPGAAAPPSGAQPGAPGGIDSGAVQAGLDALIKMLQPGTPPPAQAGGASGLQNEISDILGGKRP